MNYCISSWCVGRGGGILYTCDYIALRQCVADGYGCGMTIIRRTIDAHGVNIVHIHAPNMYVYALSDFSGIIFKYLLYCSF